MIVNLYTRNNLFVLVENYLFFISVDVKCIFLCTKVLT